MLLYTHKLLIVLFLACCSIVSTAFGQTIVYVTQSGAGDQTGSSWGNALPGTQLQPRLAAASAGTQFWVAAGTYKPTTGTDRNVSFAIPSGVQVYGGFLGNESQLIDRKNQFPSGTIFSGEIGSGSDLNDNSFHVVSFLNASSDTRIDGVAIRYGSATNAPQPANAGGGIFIDGSQGGNCQPLITNCFIGQNLSAQNGGGVFNNGYLGNASPTFINCRISGNRSGYGGGMYNNGFQGNSNPKLINCLFDANQANDGGALYNEAFQGTANVTIVNCTFTNNTSFATYTIVGNSYSSSVVYNHGPQGDSRALFQNCIVWDNLPASQFLPMYNNEGAIFIAYSDIQSTTPNLNFSGPGNVNQDPLFVNAPANDFRLLSGSPLINAGIPASTTASVSVTDLAGKPRVQQGRIDMGVYEYQGIPAHYFVTQNGSGDQSGSSWNNALPGSQLNEHLGGASAGSTYWLAQGTYKPKVIRTETFLIPSGVQVYGGFAGTETLFNERVLSNPSSTTLSGEVGLQNTVGDNSFHVVTFKNASASTRLDGVVITGGNANGSYPQTKGGGIYCDGRGQNNRCEPTLSNCLITKNNAGHGGGLYSDGEQSGNASPTILNCVFELNMASGGGGGTNHAGLPGSGSPTYVDCKFLNNVAMSQGGGLYYGGYFSVANDNVKLTNCVFRGNTAQAGAGIFCFNSFSASLNLILTNCLFERNSASDRGGAIYLNTSSSSRMNPILKNCTFSGNQAVNSGGNFFGSIGSDTYCAFNITSTIIRDGGFGYEVNPNRIAPTYNITYSNIQGGFTGTGNIDAEPLFVDPANGNYRLQPGSPSINTGDPASTTASVSATDLAGNPRIDNARIDMGAYERQTLTGPILTLKEGNWNDPFTWLYQQLPGAGDTILIRHRVGLPASYVGKARTVQYDANGQLVFSPDARLNLN